MDEMPEYKFSFVAAVSNRDDAALAMELGFETVAASNSMLGLKMNVLAQEAAKIKADYYLQMGSDNLITSDWVRQAKKQIDAGADMVADRTLYFVEPYTWRACTYTYWTPDLNLCGAARLFTPVVFDICIDDYGDVFLWPDEANKGLDGKSEAIIKQHGLKVEQIKLPKGKPHMIDIKSETNIWDFDRFYNTTNRVRVDEATWFCSPAEIEYIYKHGCND